ncbi:hypothetical protein GCM10027037_01380 [Mucilaginibacter koreensis]
MNKLYTPLFLLLLSGFFISQTASAQITTAQTSIIPNISEEYIDRLVAVAQAYYPRVKANTARVNIARNNIGKAKISWFDSFTFSYLYQPSQTTVVNPQQPAYSYFNGIQAGLFLNLGTILQKPYQIRQSKEELVVANRDRDEYLITLSTEVRTRYYTYIRLLVGLRNLTQAVIDASNSVQEIKNRYQKGEDTFDNYNRAQNTFATQLDLKYQGEANLLIAKAQLESLLGDKIENIK